MATFLKRGSRWRVQIRRNGFPPLCKTFSLKSDAEKWARDKERAIDRAELPINVSDLKATTVGDLLRRYQETVTLSKRGKESEGYRIKTILSHEISSLSLNRLSAASIASYRDQRLLTVSPSSVLRELAILSHVFHLAMRDWGIPLPSNPVANISKPTPNKARTRRLETGELETIDKALKQCRNPLVRQVTLFALATAMRRGEVLSLTWSNIDLEQRTAHLPLTKNGSSRTVPLSPTAIAVLETLPRASCLAFPISANAFRLSWERVKERAKVEDLRFHDLRHEAVSSFFELGLSIPEVALISGHKDTRMLQRYTHLRASDVARKLEVSNNKI
jgi:integrase